MTIISMEKQRTITIDDVIIGDKEIHDAVSAALKYVDSRPKLGVLRFKSKENKMNDNMKPIEEFAGLGKEVFICKREYFGDPSLWHKVSLADDNTVSISSDSATGQQTFKKKPRSFTGTFTFVDDMEAYYEAQMLAVTVLPVFSKSMLSVCQPHIPFQMRGKFTKLYRNPMNFFYKELANRLSYPIRDPKWFPSLIKE